jgi:chromosome segregation ATPase
MRKMQAQLSSVQKEKTELAARVDEMKKQLGELGSKSAILEKKSGGQKKQFAELTAKLQESDTNLQKMTQQYTDTIKALQQVQKEKEQVQKEKEQSEKQLSGDVRVCEKKNADLYRISTELMEKYQSKGVFTALLEAEPFTQLEKVKVQNLMQEYKDKSDAVKIAVSIIPASPKVSEKLATAQRGSQPVTAPAGGGAVEQTKSNPVLAEAQGGVNSSQAPANKSNIAPSGKDAGSTGQPAPQL